MQMNFLRGTGVGSCVGGQEWVTPPLLCPPAWGQHVCWRSTGIHLRTRSFYLAHRVASANPYFFILRSYWSWGLEVWDLMSFISQPSPAAAFFFSFRGLPRNQTSPSPSDAALADSSIWTPAAVAQGLARSLSEAPLRFSCMILKTECEERKKKKKHKEAYLHVRLIKILSQRRRRGDSKEMLMPLFRCTAKDTKLIFT